MNSLKFWIQACRPKTLIAALIPVTGAYLLARAESFSVTPYIFISTLLAAISIQISTNLFNDYFDNKKGSDTENRLGPKRALSLGIFSARKVLIAAIAFDLLAFVFAIPLFQERGWGLIILGVLCALMAVSYTGGPFPLTHLGLGEVFVLIFFGWVATFWSYFVFTGLYSFYATLLGLQLGALSCVLITVNNLRDEAEDRSTAKKTLVVRWGKAFGLKLLSLELLLPYLLLLFWKNYSKLYFLPLILYPFALNIHRAMSREEMSPRTNRFLAYASLHALAFLTLWGIGVFYK